MISTKVIARNVRKRRRELGFSQQKLSAAAGLARNYVCLLEGGHFRSIYSTTLDALAKVLRIKPGALMVVATEREEGDEW